MYYWNTRGRRDRDYREVWFTTTYVMYYWNIRGRRGRDHSCKSHHHMITTTTASCISVIYDICSCKSHHHMITATTASCISVIHEMWLSSYYDKQNIFINSNKHICHILLKYKGQSWSWSYGGVIYNYICHVLLKYKRPSWPWSLSSNGL
jgi:hypothetical protein